MKEIILIKNGELALKGLNRRTFEDRLIKNLKHRLAPIGDFQISIAQSTITVEPKDEFEDMDRAADAVSKVFGIAGYSRAAAVNKDMQSIVRAADIYLKPQLSRASTFKVESRRSDKHFPLKSPEISREVGGYLLKHNPNLKVDVHHPDVTVNVEVREKYAFLHGNQNKGAGGMPVGTAGKASILISGGIDSPVAAYMMAKRGLILTGIHFASPPYTSDRAEQKVRELMTEVADYAGRMDLFVVNFTEIQEQIKDCCPEDLFTIIMRRMMMRCAERIARSRGCGALITGESLGQVASQTLDAIQCTDAVTSLPLFRPLIGMDKNEIVAVSREIGTFDTSILPYEDCCTVFTPKHPRLHPNPETLERAERNLDIENLVDRAVNNTKLTVIERNA